MRPPLSFLGFGLPIEVPSWGGMLSREGREFMEAGATAGSLARSLPDYCTVYCLNMLGDALRDLLDPRLRGRRIVEPAPYHDTEPAPCPDTGAGIQRSSGGRPTLLSKTPTTLIQLR